MHISHLPFGGLDKMIVIFGIESCEQGSRKPELQCTSPAAVSFRLSHQAAAQNFSPLNLDN